MLERVLPSCAAVAATSHFVTIDEAALQAFAPTVAAHVPERMVHTPHHRIGRIDETIAYFLVLDSLNFGSGFFADLGDYRGEAGYFAVATALGDWFDRDGVPDADALARQGPDEIAAILGQDGGSVALAPFLDWCAEALQQLSVFVSTQLDGDYASLLDRTGGQADRIIDLLWTMPYFRDVADLDGRKVYLLKRAQIFVHDLAIALAQDDRYRIAGLDRLTAFADNMLPFVLEANGVLHYRADLSERVNSLIPLQPGSREEIELRAFAIHATERLRLTLKQHGIDLSAREIDFALWNIGNATPPGPGHNLHICHTYFY
jgi:hypothetical protein